MNAYQNFLDFFSMHNKERLDGLSESYFLEMSQQERGMAFNHLLKMVEVGGSEESIHGLFLADKNRASSVVNKLLKTNVLHDDAKIAAAWNLFRVQPDSSLLPIFVQLMSSSDKRVRAKAAYYVPCDMLTQVVIDGLKGMIRTETETLALVNATNKLLECYGITRDSVGKEEFSCLYRGLRSENSSDKESAFHQLDRICKPQMLDD